MTAIPARSLVPTAFAAALSFVLVPCCATSAEFRAGSIVVSEPFVLEPAPGAESAAAYMRIENAGEEADRLVAATAEMAAEAAIEEATDTRGMTEVRRLEDGLDVPPGRILQLRPGSYRLLFSGLTRELEEGERFKGTLLFEKAGAVAVTFEVGPYVAPIGAPFSLIDQNGAAFSSEALNGKPYAIFFGFTHCPDVCPTTLFEMSEALTRLGDDGVKLNVVFITVDPARDTPELLREYLGAFDPRIVGLTGTEDEIAATAKAFRIFFQKVPAEDGDYTMDHSASVILMDAEGKFVGTISYGEDIDVRLAKLRQLLAGAR
jgi:protein SCO1/2